MNPAPKDQLANARYRRAILKRAAGDPAFQQELWIRASRDIVWYCDTFLWTYSPKDQADSPNRPFILWDYQEDALHKILAGFGDHDVVIEKSRDMGATWLCALAIEWRWHFRSRQSFLVGSRKEELVDKSGDPKSIFWKIDYLLEHLPGWLVPNHDRIKLHLANLDNNSTIDGESTNDDFARGDRRTAILLDEFPAVENGYSILNATRDATRCRILNGTPQGASGAYYDTRQKTANNFPDRLIRLHWSQHPEKSLGLYTSDEVAPGKFNMRIIDQTFKFPVDYEFVLDGKMRSPWYDDQCKRAASQQEIAQELDIDYAASGWQFFDTKVLEKIIKATARPPLLRGEFFFDPSGKNPAWITQSSGRVQLWITLGKDGKLLAPDRKYAVGCDVATGKGGEMSSNSVASIVDIETGEKVGQFHTAHLSPPEFCKYVLAICRFFNNAFLIWEDNGPGGEFQKAVKEAGYRKVFYAPKDELDFNNRKSHTPGWHSTKETKRTVISEYATALIAGAFVNQCEEALKECGEYVHEPNGTIRHAKSKDHIDPTAIGENHGDMVIADALACRAMKDFPRKKKPEEGAIDPENPPYGTFAWREKQHRDAAREAGNAWDHQTNDDLAAGGRTHSPVW